MGICGAYKRLGVTIVRYENMCVNLCILMYYSGIFIYGGVTFYIYQ